MHYSLVGESGLIPRKIISFFGRKLSASKIYSRKREKNFFDLTQPKTIENLGVKDSLVIFSSSISSPDKCEEDFTISWDVNVTNTSMAIEKLLNNNNKVLFLSSDNIYGGSKQSYDEDSPVNPKHPYALMKYAVESAFLPNNNFYSLRLSYVYTGDDKFTQNVLHSKKVEVFDGFFRSIVHINDLLRVLLKYGNDKKLPNVLNLVGPECISRETLIKYIIRDKKVDVDYKIIEPPRSFFKSRPSIINCKSIYLDDILENNRTSFIL